MKKTALFILTLVFIQLGSAQSFAPIGSKWNYTYSNFYVFGYVELESVSDTIVNGLDCKKLSKTRETFNYMTDEFLTENLSFEMISSDEDNVYIFRNGQFYTLYDFSAEINDTWEIPKTYETFEENCDTTGIIQVIARGDTIIEGNNLRYIIVEPLESSSWGINGLIIENIGAVEYYILPEQQCIVDFFEGGLFRCYSDDIFDIHVGSYPCTYITVGLNKVEKNSKLRTFPNPACDYITFESPNSETFKHIKIYNSMGQLIENLTANQSSIQWNCQNHTSGVYFYEGEIGGEVYRGKIVLK